MFDVAADGDDQPFERAKFRTDRRGVEQRLGRVFALAGAAINDRAGQHVRERMMQRFVFRPHDNDVGRHRRHGLRRVDLTFAFMHGGGGDRHVDHVGAQFLARKLERQIGAGGVFEKEIHLRFTGEAFAAPDRSGADKPA